jgi:hypothetical protein
MYTATHKKMPHTNESRAAAHDARATRGGVLQRKNPRNLKYKPGFLQGFKKC